MQTSEISIPSKVFLAGEYLALEGGPALVAAVEPHFSLRYEGPNSEKQQNPFHAESLAGRWWKLHDSFYSQYRLRFIDPHQSQGGFGGSTAEFALLHALLDLKQSLSEDFQATFDLRRIWNDYRNLAASGSMAHGVQPSGADLIGQINGHLTIFERDSGKINQYSWLFQDLGFLLFRTSKKIATHEHLRGLSGFSVNGLQQSMHKIIQGLVTSDVSDFVLGMNDYAEELSRLGFVASGTKEILQQVNFSSILAKKGCGAMGADVICLIDRPSMNQREQVKDHMRSLGCTFVANENNLCGGLKLQTLVAAGEAQDVSL